MGTVAQFCYFNLSDPFLREEGSPIPRGFATAGITASSRYGRKGKDRIDMIFRISLGCLLSVVLLFGECAIPSAASTQVRFPSLDDNGTGQPATMLDGFLFLPPDGARHPAVIFLHGCSGLGSAGAIGPRDMEWATRINSLGYTVLMVNSFTPRSIVNTCSLRVTDPDRWFDLMEKRKRDALGALSYLQSQPYVQPDKVAVIGWSQGGGVVLMVLNTKGARLPAGAPLSSFRAAVAFYPVLCSEKEQPGDWRNSVPLLLLQGWSDTWTRAPPCKSFVNGAIARGAKIEMQIYPDAYHDFDAPGVPLHTLNVYSPEGTSPYVGTDPAARTDAFARVPAFLARYLLQ
jgi:dienelactone hydrolase